MGKSGLPRATNWTFNPQPSGRGVPLSLFSSSTSLLMAEDQLLRLAPFNKHQMPRILSSAHFLR